MMGSRRWVKTLMLEMHRSFDKKEENQSAFVYLGLTGQTIVEDCESSRSGSAVSRVFCNPTTET